MMGIMAEANTKRKLTFMMSLMLRYFQALVVRNGLLWSLNFF